LVPFIGAGISSHAIRKDERAFPMWTDLIGDLIRSARDRRDITDNEFEEMERLLSLGKHLMVAQVLKRELGDMLETEMRNRLSPNDAEPGPIHRRLFDLNCQLILTTNYDCLLEHAYTQKTGKHVRVVTFESPMEVQHVLRADRSAAIQPLLFKMHGGFESGGVILTTMDYRHLMSREDYRLILSIVFIAKVVLMIGFSFSDPDLISILDSVRPYRSGFLVLPSGERGPVEKRYLLEYLGIEVIEYKPTPGHPELLELVDYLAEVAKNEPTTGG
jgi:hypothetical protein